jgi:hypothetical protein
MTSNASCFAPTFFFLLALPDQWLVDPPDPELEYHEPQYNQQLLSISLTFSVLVNPWLHHHRKLADLHR